MEAHLIAVFARFRQVQRTQTSPGSPLARCGSNIYSRLSVPCPLCYRSCCCPAFLCPRLWLYCRLYPSSNQAWDFSLHEIIDGTYRQTNLANESPEYLAKGEELRLAEIELLNTRERVAALRRALPRGATIQDYEFIGGPQQVIEKQLSSHV